MQIKMGMGNGIRKWELKSGIFPQQLESVKLIKLIFSKSNISGGAIQKLLKSEKHFCRPSENYQNY